MPLCESSSAAAVVRSFPRAAVTHTLAYTHTDGLYTTTHERMHASIIIPTIRTHTNTEARTHETISQTVKSKVPRWTNRASEGPRTTVITLCRMTQFREYAQSHQNMLFVTRPRKTCLSCCPLRVMCSPTRRSKYNYSATQRPPFIFPDGKSSPGSDLNMTAKTYHRIFESKAGEFRGIILL